jgi:hypothetical protein
VFVNSVADIIKYKIFVSDGRTYLMYDHKCSFVCAHKASTSFPAQIFMTLGNDNSAVFISFIITPNKTIVPYVDPKPNTVILPSVRRCFVISI